MSADNHFPRREKCPSVDTSFEDSSLIKRSIFRRMNMNLRNKIVFGKDVDSSKRWPSVTFEKRWKDSNHLCLVLRVQREWNSQGVEEPDNPTASNLSR
jgi:hypothetical protein